MSLGAIVWEINFFFFFFFFLGGGGDEIGKQHFEIGELWNFPLVFVFQISSRNAQM